MDEEYLKLKEQEFRELFGEEVNLHAALTYQQGNYIESLLQRANIPEQQEREIYRNLYDGLYNVIEAQEVIDLLFKNQVDPVSSGFNYQMNDIKRKLNGETT